MLYIGEGLIGLGKFFKSIFYCEEEVFIYFVSIILVGVCGVVEVCDGFSLI